jgi:hypothetical protein
MSLCMFHPLDHPLERGWVGRIDGDRVIQLAAQTLQSLFTGGGSAREHAVYALAAVRLLAPVLHPPAVRVFEDQTTFAFANPAAIVGPGADVTPSNSLLQEGLVLVPRLAGVIGADGALAGFTAFVDWRDPARLPPKDRDFALGVGPVVVTSDELDLSSLEAIVRIDGRERARARFDAFDWKAAVDFAAEGTTLKSGDVIAGPSDLAEKVPRGSVVELELGGIGVLDQVVSA